MVIESLLTNGSAASGSSATTASILPTANNLIIVAVVNYKTGTADIPTVSGCNMTWVNITNRKANTNSWNITLFRGLSASPTTGALTIDFGGQNQDTGIGWFVSQFSGVKTSGTNGSDAVVQSGSNLATGTNTGLTITLGVFANILNATYGVVTSQGASITVGSGFSQIGSFGAGAGAAFQSEWKNTNDTTIDWTWGSIGTEAPGIAIEIAAQPATGFFAFL